MVFVIFSFFFAGYASRSLVNSITYMLPGVHVLTNKSVYVSGENVTITIVNNLKHSISYSYTWPLPFLLINVKTGETFYLHPPPDSGFAVIQIMVTIEAGSSKAFEWNQEDWRGYFRDYLNSTENFLVPPGTYKLKFVWSDGENTHVSYSAQFEIVEK